MFGAPYTNEVLALANAIPHLGDLPDAEGRAEARSTVCGSRVGVAVRLDGEGRIAALGLDVEACALGQAAAAVFAEAAIGASLAEIESARDALATMLKGEGDAPDGRFVGLAALRDVQAYPRRHASTQLAFKAGAQAVAEALEAREAAA